MTLAINSSAFNQDEHNSNATNIIKKYVARHAFMDVGVGLVGTLVPIPGAGLAAVAVSLLAQSSVIYQPMVRELSVIYTAPSSTFTTSLLSGGATVLDTGVDLIAEFGQEFLGEVIWELLQEMGIGAAASCIPFIGGFASAAIDAVAAATLTWAVGTMTVLYFRNGCEWPLGSKKATWTWVREEIGLQVPLGEGVSIQEIIEKQPSIRASDKSTALELALTLQMADKTKEEIRSILIKRGLQTDIVDEVLDDM